MTTAAIDKRIERTGRVVGKELGRLVRRLEKEGWALARKGKQMQAAGRKHSMQLLRRTARALNKLALDLEKADKGRRRGAARQPGKKRRR